MRTLGLCSALVLASMVACSTESKAPDPTPPVDENPSTVHGCNEATPLTPSCLHDQGHSIFVSGAGSDVLGDGSRDRPVKTIHQALAMLTPDRRRIYVCQGTYEENLILGEKEAGVTLVGGLDCEWHPNGSRTVIGDGVTLPVIDVSPAEAPITIDGFETRPLATSEDTVGCGKCAPFPPTFAVRARPGASLVLRHSRLVAPKGRDGAPGVGRQAGPEGTFMLPLPGDGSSIHCNSGGGWAGGHGSSGSTGEAASGKPEVSPNAGADGVACEAGGDGQVGAAGADATEYGGGASSYGEIIAYDGMLDWVPAAGAVGANGAPGQGGGGGGVPSDASNSAVGGGGGAGGCGGFGGGFGGGGGGSIAILSLNATVTVRESVLETLGGGNGGDGVVSLGGSSGMEGFTGTDGGCKGGKGGHGGNGAPGGGGAGGISVGVLFSGTAPDLDSATTASMVLGPPGKGGAGPAGNKGIDGIAAPSLEVGVLVP